MNAPKPGDVKYDIPKAPNHPYLDKMVNKKRNVKPDDMENGAGIREEESSQDHSEDGTGEVEEMSEEGRGSDEALSTHRHDAGCTQRRIG